MALELLKVDLVNVFETPSNGSVFSMTAKPNILVIDDDRAVREALDRVLRVEQFEVVLAANAEEALREFLRHKVDAVLLDLNLSHEENGWDTFDALNQLAPSLPILVMSGQPDRFSHASAHAAAALLPKPIDFSALFEKRHRKLREPVHKQQGS
jgi:DNA-binding NtrC family response regulator